MSLPICATPLWNPPLRYGTCPANAPQFQRRAELRYTACADMFLTLKLLLTPESTCTTVVSVWSPSMSPNWNPTPPPTAVPKRLAPTPIVGCATPSSDSFGRYGSEGNAVAAGRPSGAFWSSAATSLGFRSGGGRTAAASAAVCVTGEPRPISDV